MSDPNGQAQTPELQKTAAALAFKKDEEARALQRRKERSRHEAAHVVVGDAIKEDMEWVNVDGKPGVDNSMVHFNYSAQALSILKGNWSDTASERKKAVDLAICFAAGHLIQSEKFNDETVSQRIAKAKSWIFGTERKGSTDRDTVAWLVSLLGKPNVETVIAIEKEAKKHIDANRPKLDRIIQRLVETGYIDGQEFIDIRKDPPA